MFGSLGGPEVLLILVIALLVFGPRKLPEIGRTVGKTLAELRKATYDFRSSLEREVEIEKLRDVHSDVKSAAKDAAGAVSRAARPGIPPAGAEPAVPSAGPEGEAPASPGDDGSGQDRT